MAEDEAAPNNLISAIKRVHEMPWPKVREAALLRGLEMILELLNFEIVKIDSPVTPGGDDKSKQPAKEK